MKEKLLTLKCFFNLALLSGVAGFAGCSVGPNYHRPPALASSPVPDEFGDTSVTNIGQWKTAAPAAQIPRGTWWNIYNDEELNRLEAMAATNNQQITLAIANLDQAREALQEARSSYYPQISANPAVTRQRTSANSSPVNVVNNNGTVVNSGRTYNVFDVSGDASWEVDLWGRVRRLSESARAQLTASADDLESTKLSVQAAVASDYFTLRALDEQSRLLSETVASYQRALDLTTARQKSGIADEQDVAQAETQLSAARAQIPAADLQRAQTRHALAVLCGQAATTFALASNSIESTNVPAIPVAVPSEWLEHRPDIAAAERGMAAANANVGVATAAFYPKLTLTASGGFESVNASTLFDWPSRLWAVGPNLQLPLFTGGFNRAQLKSAEAAYRGSVASYRQTVLTAFQDVEDQLAAQDLQADQLKQEAAALKSARHSLDIALQRYKSGVEQYLDVITAQTTELTEEETVIQLKGQRLVTSVSLVKALGAGWSADTNAPPVSK